jgi:hypothetical protein
MTHPRSQNLKDEGQLYDSYIAKLHHHIHHTSEMRKPFYLHLTRTLWLEILTRWPYSLSLRPMPMKGWTSPRVPTICVTITRKSSVWATLTSWKFLHTKRFLIPIRSTSYFKIIGRAENHGSTTAGVNEGKKYLTNMTMLMGLIFPEMALTLWRKVDRCSRYDDWTFLKPLLFSIRNR